MPSGGGKKGGGSGGATAPTISSPDGLLQNLNNVQSIGQYGQGTFNTLSGLGNWAANIASGGHNQPIGSFEEIANQTGPTLTIGSGGPPGHDSWATSFDPQTGMITLTNAQTGGTFQTWFQSDSAKQWFDPTTLAQWGQLYNNRGAGTPAAGTGESNTSWWQNLGPSLQTAWDQIQSIRGIERQTSAFNTQANSLVNQDISLQTQDQADVGIAQARANNEYAQAQQLYNWATTGLGVTPSQLAFINQGVTSEQTQLSQQLAAEGLGNSTANAILRGEAAQQGAATAGQLQQGNISLAQNAEQNAQKGQALVQSAQAIVQNQENIVQGAQKLALAGQTLSLGEATAMAGLAQSFQAQTWSEAMQAYQTLGQMMSTTGALYGIDVTGYSNILQANIAQGQLSLEAALGQMQASIGSMQSMGSGLGALLGSGGIGGLFGGGGGAAGAGAAGASAAGGGGLFGSLFSGLGSAGSAILSGIGAIFAAL